MVANIEFGNQLGKVYPEVSRYARRLTRDGETAQDLTQEACKQAIRGANGFELGTNIRAWALKITQRTFLNFLEKQKTQPPTVSIEKNQAMLEDDSRQVQDILAGHTHPSAESVALGNIRKDQIMEAIDDLPPRFRQAIQLVGVLGLSSREASEIAGQSQGTFGSNLSRARQELRDRLFELGVLE